MSSPSNFQGSCLIPPSGMHSGSSSLSWRGAGIRGVWGSGGSIRSALEMQRVKGERVWMLFLGTTFSTHDLVLRKIIWRIKKEKKSVKDLYFTPNRTKLTVPLPPKQKYARTYVQIMTGVNKEQKNAGQTVSQNMFREGNWHSNLTFAEAVVHFMQNHTQTMATLPHQAHLISAYLTCRAIADTTVGDKCKKHSTRALPCQ